MGGGISKPATGAGENIPIVPGQPSFNPMNEAQKDKTTPVAQAEIHSETKNPKESSPITNPKVNTQKNRRTEAVVMSSLGIRFEDSEKSSKTQEKTLKTVNPVMDNNSIGTSPLTTTDTQRNTPITASLARRSHVTLPQPSKTKLSQDLEGLPKKQSKPELEHLDLETRKVLQTPFKKIESYLNPYFKPTTKTDLLNMVSLANLIKKEDPEKFFQLYEKAILASERILNPNVVTSESNAKNKNKFNTLLELQPVVQTMSKYHSILEVVKKTPVELGQVDKVDFLLECLKNSTCSEPTDALIIVDKLPNGPEKTRLLRDVFQATRSYYKDRASSFTKDLDRPLPDCLDDDTKVLCNFVISLLELDEAITPASHSLIKNLPDTYPRKELLLAAISKNPEISPTRSPIRQEFVAANKIISLIKDKHY